MKVTIVLCTVILVAAALVFVGCCCFKSKEPTLALKNKPDGKVLIVYYSQSKTKNTRTVAQWIHNQVGGDLVEIEMVNPYSDSYSSTLKEAKKDIDAKNLPEIKPFPQNAADYDIIFIGSPIWYGTFAPPVGTFLSQADLKGKTVIPFCTHGGGGAGTFYDDVKKSAPEANMLEGIAIRGTNVVERTIGYGTDSRESPDVVIKWLNRILAK